MGAQFDIAYTKTMGVEGRTNWNPADKGNVVEGGKTIIPTYAGIAPAFFRDWKGFQYIKSVQAGMAAQPRYDSAEFWNWKKRLDKILAETPVLQNLVKAFYRSNVWDANRLSELSSQDAADWMFDHIVNAGGRGARWAQLAARVTPDGAIGPKSIAAINAMAPKVFLRRVEDIAGKYRLDVAHDHPSQIQFLSSWLGRDGQPPEIIAMVKAAARDGRLDDREVAAIGAAMEAAG